MPDKKRLLVAGFGEDVLIEKATGFRIGPHKIETAASKQALIGIKIGMPNAKKMYVIGGVGGWELGAFIEVLNNAPQFVFFLYGSVIIPTEMAKETHALTITILISVIAGWTMFFLRMVTITNPIRHSLLLMDHIISIGKNMLRRKDLNPILFLTTSKSQATVQMI